MGSLLDLIRPTPESIQQMMMQQRMQQSPSPVNLMSSGGEENPDWLTEVSAAPVPVQRVRSPIMRMAARQQSAFEPTSGSKMEAESRNSIDDLMAKLASQRDRAEQDNRNQQWMSFFGKLASSSSPTLLGGLGEASNALAETTAKQTASGQAMDRGALEDQIKYEEWKREQDRQEQALAQTGAYQQGELALKKEALGPESALKAAQAEYYKSGAGTGNRAISVIDPETGTAVLMPAREAMVKGAVPTSAYNSTTVTLSPEAIEMYAKAVAKGAKGTDLGLGYGMNANKKAVFDKVAQDYPDLDLAGAQTNLIGERAGARTVGTTSGKIEFASQSLGSMIPLAKKASADLDRTQYPTINAIENAVAQGTGDKKIIALNTYLNAVMADQANLFVRGGLSTDAARAKAAQMANAALSNGQLNTYFDSVQNEISAQRAAGKNAMSIFTGKQSADAAKSSPAETQDSTSAPDYSHLWGK